MRRKVHPVLPFGCAVLCIASATPATGQQAPGAPPPGGGTQGDTIDLVFEREVFSYPAFDRRNPFRPLTAADSGPRFEDLVLLGVIVSSNRSGSVATVGEHPPGSVQQAPTRTHRLREGEVLGNSRVMEIREQMILVQVEEFGLFELRTLELRRMDPDRTPAPGEPQAEPDATDPPSDPAPRPGVPGTPPAEPGIPPADPAMPPTDAGPPPAHPEASAGDPAATPPSDESEASRSEGFEGAFVHQRPTGNGART